MYSKLFQASPPAAASTTWNRSVNGCANMPSTYLISFHSSFDWNSCRYRLKMEWAVRSTPLMTWKLPLFMRSTMPWSRSGHLSGKSSTLMRLMASLSCRCICSGLDNMSSMMEHLIDCRSCAAILSAKSVSSLRRQCRLTKFLNVTDATTRMCIGKSSRLHRNNRSGPKFSCDSICCKYFSALRFYC